MRVPFNRNMLIALAGNNGNANNQSAPVSQLMIAHRNGTTNGTKFDLMDPQKIEVHENDEDRVQVVGLNSLDGEVRSEFIQTISPC
jgi:hypothetical protein